MVIRTRLDTLVKIRERAEDGARLELARAQKRIQLAEAALAEAKARALADHRRAGTAGDWQVAEAARSRALVEVRKAEQALALARQKSDEARQAFEQAHRQSEAVKRAAQAKRDEITLQLERAERKHLDELAVLQFGRKKGG
ncbi:MAG: flagellar FliJ family protein [Deltaproteobacteria bacterium]|nr:flagellar FliJ family protein [Deltaproteobacteria bacterium]